MGSEDRSADTFADSTSADGTSGAGPEALTFDTSIAHPARVYNYWLGGKDNYEADRVAGQAAITAEPDLLHAVQANRAFLGRAVRYLVKEAGIRQFIDIGTGLPTADNTHEVAQAIDPQCQVVYVDNDPIVLAHARALLTSTPEGATHYLDADARDTDTILSAAGEFLDLSQPVAVIALMVMQYIQDSDGPHEIISRLMEAMPSGSYLVMANVTTDIGPGRAANIASKVNGRMGPTRLTPRPRTEIARFYDGLDLIEPGLVPVPEWRGEASTVHVVSAYAGVARKP